MGGNDLFGLLTGISPWMWIALGVALGAVEMASMSFFLIWPGLAAVAMGVILWLVPDLSGAAQVTVFAAMAVALTLVGRWIIRRFGQAPSDRPDLNRRSAQLVGRRGAVLSPFEGGEGAVEIDGVRWQARATGPDAPAIRDAVRVTGVEGMVLIVEAE